MPPKRAHFIGIAGMGMSAVAILLKEQDWTVTGSDSDMYPPATTQLERHGISYNTSYSPTNIPKDTDLIVIGKNAKLTRENNPEVKAAYESGIRVASFPEVLSELIKNRQTIVVAGSYGKSTTTSLIAWILSRSGVDAGWFIGASPEGMEPSHLGTRPTFVLEGDEYPTSHDDPRPKFAHYKAHDALITAAIHDHVNVYKNQEDFLAPFRALVTDLPKEGLLVLCIDEHNAQSLAQETRARVVWYGLNPNTDWYATSIARGLPAATSLTASNAEADAAQAGEKTTFDLMRGEERIAQLSTTLLGDHNIQNIVGAAAMLLEKKLVTPEQITNALIDFKGLGRRLDKKTTLSRVPAYEGFGSSREKLQAAIKALKAQYSDKRLVVVFEPHTFSWRNRNMLHWFDDAFSGAASVILYKPAEQGASTHEQSTQEEMVARLSAAGISVTPATNSEDVITLLSSEIRDEDVILLSSSGPMNGLIERIPQWLDEKFV